MRVLIYADFRSPHSRGWLTGLEQAGIDTLALSSERVEGLRNVENPDSWVAAARQSLVKIRSAGGAGSVSRTLASKSPPEELQACIAIARLAQRRRQIASACERFQPDIVHALRLPYEGLTVLTSGLNVPIVVSTWGADFYPQAENSKILATWIRSRIGQVAGIHYDAKEDYVRALKYGLPVGVPQLHAAGNFGVDGSLFYSSGTKEANHIVYPRGISHMSNPRGFIKAASLLAHVPGIRFTAVGLQGVDFAEEARESKALKGKLTLTPRLSRDKFAELIRSAGIVVSPGFSDGMPNSVLESLASGCAVVVGRLPQFETLASSLSNLYLTDQHQPQDVASSILLALKNTIVEAETIPFEYRLEANLDRVPKFYDSVLRSSSAAAPSA